MRIVCWGFAKASLPCTSCGHDDGGSGQLSDFNHTLNRDIATGPRLGGLGGSFSALNCIYKLPERGSSGLKESKYMVDEYDSI